MLHMLPVSSNASLPWTGLWESLQGLSSYALCPLWPSQREGPAIQPGLEGKPMPLEIPQTPPCTSWEESNEDPALAAETKTNSGLNKMKI